MDADLHISHNVEVLARASPCFEYGAIRHRACQDYRDSRLAGSICLRMGLALIWLLRASTG